MKKKININFVQVSVFFSLSIEPQNDLLKIKNNIFFYNVEISLKYKMLIIN